MAVLAAFRNLHLHLAAVDGGHFQFAAQGRGGHGDGHAHEQIGAFALEHAVGRNGEKQIEITRGRTIATGFAFAGEADPRAFLDTGRNSDVESLVLAGPAGAAALGAGIGDDLSAAVTGGARTLHREKPLLAAHAALATAGGAGGRCSAAFAAGA